MTSKAKTHNTGGSNGAPDSWDGKFYHMRFPDLVQQPERKIVPEAMLLGGPAPALQRADTYDWDTVFAIKFPDANLALAKPGATPESFTVTIENTSASGTFDPWQLSGGSGVLLHMSVPIKTGKTTYEGEDYDMAGAVATLEIELMDLPQPATANGTPHQIVADPEKPVSVIGLSNVPGSPSFIVKAVMSGLLAQWFNDNLENFTYAFSTINLNEKADKDQFQWMKPTAFGWAVSAQGTLEESVFGVLSMTENRNRPNTMEISPNAIPSGQVSGFLIAQERFLENLLLPGIYTLFSGSKVTDFEAANDGAMIRNVNPVYMEPVKIGTIYYTPEIPANHFQLTLEANEIKVELLKAAIDFSPGIKIMMDYTAFSSIALGENSKGEQILLYQEASPPIIGHNVEVASWVIWSEVAASVLAAVATLGAGAVAKKVIERVVYRVVAVIIVLLVGELIANISLIITAVAAGNKDAIPPVNLMVASATDPITWPDSGDFLLTSAWLNESLQFGGDPRFVH